MKAEEIIATDTKNNQKVLPRLEENSPYLLEVKEKYCRKCARKTSHEWVRNHHFHYWRCPECLERHLETIGTFTPTGFFKKTTKNLEVSKWEKA